MASLTLEQLNALLGLPRRCGLCPGQIDASDPEVTGYLDYGLCHDACIHMAENGPSDAQLNDWAESPRSIQEREWDQKRRLG